MQGQGRAGFPRAVNPETFALFGDPERWGGSGRVTVSTVVAASTPFPEFEYAPEQLVRAQMPGLAACGWDFFLVAEFGGDFSVADDTVQVAIDIVAGVGQTSARFVWGPQKRTNVLPGLDQLYPANTLVAGRGPLWGVADHLQSPIPATSINARLAAYCVTKGTAGRDVEIAATLTIAPRVFT